jgi:hypothetical protein
MPSKGRYYLQIYIDDTSQNIPHPHYCMIMKLIDGLSINIAPPRACATDTWHNPQIATYPTGSATVPANTD